MSRTELFTNFVGDHSDGGVEPQPHYLMPEGSLFSVVPIHVGRLSLTSQEQYEQEYFYYYCGEVAFGD